MRCPFLGVRCADRRRVGRCGAASATGGSEPGGCRSAGRPSPARSRSLHSLISRRAATGSSAWATYMADPTPEGRRAGGPTARPAGARARPRPWRRPGTPGSCRVGPSLRSGHTVPTEHGRPVDQHDLAVGRVGGGGVEVDLAVGPEELPGVGRAVARATQEQRTTSADDLLEHRPEQVLLVPEVVVEGPPGQPGLPDDLLGAGGLEAVGGEELPGRVEQRPPGVLHVGGPKPGSRARIGHARSLMHIVSNIHNVWIRTGPVGSGMLNRQFLGGPWKRTRCPFSRTL